MALLKSHRPSGTSMSQTNDVSADRFAGGRSMVLSAIQSPPTATIPSDEHDVAEAAESPQDAASSFGHRNSVSRIEPAATVRLSSRSGAPGPTDQGGDLQQVVPSARGADLDRVAPTVALVGGQLGQLTPAGDRTPASRQARTEHESDDAQRGLGADRTLRGRPATSSSPRSASARSARRRRPGPTAHRSGSAPAAVGGRSGSRRCPANCRDARRTRVAGTARATTLSARTLRWRPPGSTIRRRASVRLRPMSDHLTQLRGPRRHPSAGNLAMRPALVRDGMAPIQLPPASFPHGDELSDDVVRFGPDLDHEHVEKLIGAVGSLEGRRVLDLGCGAGGSSVAIARRGARVIAVDSSTARLARARNAADVAEVKVEFHHSDLADLAFLRADTIELVVAIYSLAGVQDLGRVFRQLHRIMRPDGAAGAVAATPDGDDAGGRSRRPADPVPDPHRLERSGHHLARRRRRGRHPRPPDQRPLHHAGPLELPGRLDPGAAGPTPGAPACTARRCATGCRARWCCGPARKAPEAHRARWRFSSRSGSGPPPRGTSHGSPHRW